MSEILSNLNEQLHLDLFDDPARWPKKPYCSDDKTARCIRSLSSAIKRSYIQANPPHLRVWSIYDVDRPGGAIAWEDAGLPPPSWAAANRENGHAHLVWGLSAPVLVDGLGARDAPMRYLCAVESMTRELLQADAGFAGLITKNPAHPLWRTLRGPRVHYELGELGEYLPGLEKHKPKRRRPQEVGLGRNVTLFDHLRFWAYAHLRNYLGGGLDAWNAWLSRCNSQALTHNGEFLTPLDGREVWHVARSVAKWTWRNFDIEASDARFSAKQAYRGRKGGVASGLSRAAKNEDKRASARLMAAQGHSSRVIAESIKVNQSTVVRWLHSE